MLLPKQFFMRYESVQHHKLVKYTIVERKDLEKFAALAWTIWYRRNQVRVNQKDFPYTQICPFAT